MRRLTLVLAALFACYGGSSWVPTGRAQSLPIPKPIPATQPPNPSAVPPQAANAVDPQTAGVPIYPGAEFLESYDAGQGQRFYLYGTNTPYADIVQYYKMTLKSSGRELFKAPAMQQFDLGRFQDDAMAYPPSVVVKDYTWMDAPGYLHVSGTTETRYKTIIQIVPPPAGR